MTAVPTQRSKTKDPFQLELDKEIAKRKSRGLKTGSSDEESYNDEDKKEEYSDDYEDDFDLGSEHDSDEELYQQFLDSSSAENSISIESQPKTFTKGTNANVTSNKPQTTVSALRKTSPSFLLRQTALDEKQMDDKEASCTDNDPLLSLLQSELKPSPKTSKTVKEDDSDMSSMSRQSSTKKKVTFLHSGNGLSPRNEEPYSTFPTQSNIPAGKLSSINKDTFSPRASTLTTTSHSSLDNLLREVKPRAVPRKPSVEDLLKPQPKARRRHDSNRSSVSEESQTRSAAKSPTLDQLQEGKVETNSSAHKPLDHDASHFPSIPQTTMSSTIRRSEDLTTKKEEAITEPQNKEVVSTTEKIPASVAKPKKKVQHSDSDDMTSSAEDLLAQLQAAVDGSADAEKKTKYSPHKLEPEQQETVSVKSPTTEKAETFKPSISTDEIDESTFSHIEENSEKDVLGELKLKRPASGKRPSSRKSPRTPPVNYRGLGSLDGLQQLRTFKPTESGRLNTTTDVRSAVYLQWLADREKKLKEKKKLKLKEDEKENEKKEKELQERETEGMSARKAWLKKKKVVLKEQEQKKKKEERKKESEKEKQKEEKLKSAQKAEIVREKALEEAKKRHREEMSKKRKEEKELMKKDKEKKKENEEKLNDWMENRSKQWEKERNIKIKEKRTKEKEAKKAKESKSKDAEERYTM